MMYEGVLLFGVVMVAGFVYATLTQQRHALQGTTGLQIVIFAVLGLYFAGFWSRSGQTLAMQTWRIRIVTATGERPSLARALCRYLLAWLWFLPALLGLHLAGVKGPAPAVVTVAAGMIGYAALTRLRPDRQYWHDVVCRTRMVCTPSEKKP
jgi:uncharacterized RDD family membrane protein YckC